MPIDHARADACQYLVEPPDTWQKRVSAKHRQQAPKVLAAPDGGEAWSFEDGAWLRPLGLQASAGQSLPQDHGYTYATIAKGVFEPKARLAAMDADGMDVASIFPTFGMEVRLLQDRDLHVECVRAYNDAILDWVKQGDSQRLVPNALMPSTGVDDSLAELKRVAKAGFRGIVFPGWPKGGSIPDIEAEDPFWGLCAEAGLVVNLVRGGQVGPDRSPAAPKKYIGANGSRVRVVEPTPETWLLQSVMANAGVLQFMAGAGVLDRQPKLKLAQIDNGSGWIACTWEGMDWQHRYSQYIKIWPALKRRPSDYVQAQVKATVRNERSAIEARADIGVHMLMFASSYPTSATTWPNSQAAVKNLLLGVPEDERRKILGENFLEWYGVSAPTRSVAAR